LHRLADWLAFIVITLGEILRTGGVFVIDSVPVPICRRAPAAVESAWSRLLRPVRREKGDVVWQALESDLHTEWRVG
jgi:hypothetical protein